MRHNEYLQRKRELDERLRAGIELLEAAHRAEVQALETLWAAHGEGEGSGMDAPPEPAAPDPPILPPRPANHREAWDLINKVLKVLDQVPHEFDAKDVCLALGFAPHRASLHRAFQKLIHDGALEVQ